MKRKLLISLVSIVAILIYWQTGSAHNLLLNGKAKSLSATVRGARQLAWTSPKPGDTYYDGDSAVFRWTSENIDSILIAAKGKHDNRYFFLTVKGNPGADHPELAPVAAAQGYFGLRIPTDVSADTLAFYLFDASDATFHTVVQPIYLKDSILSVSGQKFEQLAKTPPMGWNSWNKFGCNVNEKLIIEIADAMVSSGMKNAGYKYIIIDDCWQGGRHKNGEIFADKKRFPHGMKYLANYIHSKGLKFGIYSDAGTQTCQGRPGGRGHEYQDARTYARWGVDYLKYDWCHTSTQNAKASYTAMRDALYAAGRPVVFSICDWGLFKPWKWAGKIGNLWRTTGDIQDNWNSVLAILNKQKNLYKYAGPGHWNDPDMLEVGNGGMTTTEDKAHFSLWAMLAAPLIAGNDLRNMTHETLKILTNKEIIALDQDPLGKQAFRYRDIDGYEIWIKELANNEKAVCLLNMSDEVKDVRVDFNVLLKADVNYSDPYKLANYRVRDLWEHKYLKLNKKGIVFVKMPPHSVKVYRFIKK